MDYHSLLDSVYQRAEDGAKHFEELLKVRISEPSSQVLAATYGGKLFGFIVGHITEMPSYYQDKVLGTITHITVSKDVQAKGLGTEMFDALVEWFKDQGAERVELQVSSKNEKGMGFWAKHGFEEFSRHLYKSI